MAKKSVLKPSKSNKISQWLIGATVALILLAALEFMTQNDFTNLAPTQLFLVAGVLAILALYLKDEK